MRLLALSLAALAIVCAIVVMPKSEEPAVAPHRQTTAFATAGTFSDRVFAKPRIAVAEGLTTAPPRLAPVKPPVQSPTAAPAEPSTSSSVWAAPAEFAPAER